MKGKLTKSIFLALLLVLCMSVAVAADVSENTAGDVATTPDTDTATVDAQTVDTVQSTIMDNNVNKQDETQPRHVPGDNYTFANETLDITSDEYDGHTLTLLDNVNVMSSTNQALSNIAFTVQGTNVLIQGLNITNINQNNVVINVLNNSRNVHILNNNITTISDDTTNPVEVKAITINGTNISQINGNNIYVAGVPQNDTWIRITETPSHSVDIPKVDAIEIWNSENINVLNNVITVTNTTIPETLNYSTAKGIVINNYTKDSLVDNNNITMDGYNYIHAISLCNQVTGITVSNNNIQMNGTNYINGVYLHYVTYSYITNNHISGRCFNTTTNPVSNESLAYGVNVITEDLLNQPYAESVGNFIRYNTINLTSTIVYGVELCFTNDNTVSYNWMYLNGSVVNGIPMVMSENNIIEHNLIKIKSFYSDLRNVTEFIRPKFTTGIRVYVACEGNEINYNSILVDEENDSDIHAIVMEWEYNTVSYNQLTAISDGTLTGNNAVSDEEYDNDVYANTAYVEVQSTNNDFFDDIGLKSLTKRNQITKKSSENNNIVITPETFDNYVTKGMFNDNIQSGDSIIFDGKFDGERFSLTVNKAVTMSSTPNSIFILYTVPGDLGTDFGGGIFQVIKGGSNSNISNMNFEQTRIYINGAKNVDINNISVNNGAARNTGQFSLRGQSDNITVRNSYFKTENNGGTSNFVIAGAKNCLIENNTIIGEGNVGNIFYLCRYFASMDTDGIINKNIIVRNNLIQTNCGFDICYGIAVDGVNITFENNTVIHPGHAVWTYSGVGENIKFINNYIPNGDFSPCCSDILINNTINDVSIMTDGAILINNTINVLHTASNNTVTNNNIKSIYIGSNNTVENNTFEVVKISGDNVLFNNNIVSCFNSNYSVNVTGSNVNITNNQLANKLTRGNDAIIGDAYTDNNSNATLYFYLNDENLEDYGTVDTTTVGKSKFTLSADVVQSNDYITIQSNVIYHILIEIPDTNLNLFNITEKNNPKLGRIQFKSYITVNTCDNLYLPTVKMDTTRGTIILHNCVLKELPTSVVGSVTTDNFTAMGDTYYLTYPLKTKPFKTNYLTGEGYLVDSVTEGSAVYIINYTNIDVNIDKPVNLVGVSESYMGNIITFLSGSEGTNITGVTFDEKVYVNTSNIYFTDCTFNNAVIINNGNGNILENCTFNKGVVFTNADENTLENSIITTVEDDIPVVFINSSKNTILTSTINGSTGTTISFDDDSNENIIQENLLDAVTKRNVDSITGNMNNVFIGNTELYDVTINLDMETPFYAGEYVPLNINVTNNFNNELVENGYVELWIIDGTLYENITLTNGQASTYFTYNEAKSKTLKAWYYPTEKYQNARKTKDFQTIESTGTIQIEEITGSKVGDEITIKTIINSTDVIDEGNISFQFADRNVSVPVVSNTANLTTTITTAMMDDPTLRLVFETEKARYNIKSNMTTLAIEPGVVNIVVSEVNGKINDELTLTAQVTDSNNQAIDDGEIIFTNDNGETLATGGIVEGVATANYTFTSEYHGKIIATINSTYREANSNENNLNIRKINTVIQLNTTSTNVSTGENVILSGSIVDEDGNILTYKDIELNIKLLTYNLVSNDKGEFSLPYSPTIGGTLDIVANYNGDEIYNATSSNVVEIEVTDKVAEQLNDLTNLINNLTQIIGQQVEQNNQLQEQLANQTEIINQLNDKLDNLTQANNDLSQQLEDTTNNLTGQIDDLKAQNGELNDKLDNLTQANNDLSQQLEDTTNNLTEQNNDLKEQLANVTQANEELSEQLNDTTNNLTTQNNELKEQLANQSAQIEELKNKISQLEETLEKLTAIEDTIITISPIIDAQYNTEFTITGLLSNANGNSLSNQVVTVTINDKPVNVTTVNGVFEYKAVVKNIGENNNITVDYAGSYKYNSSTANATFAVDKADCIITITGVTTAKYGENITVTGTFTNSDGKAIANSKVKLQLNGAYAYVKTDKNGAFTWITTANKAGENTIIAYYGGSTYYNSYKTNTTFNVEKQDLIITADEVLYNDGTLTIKGTFKNAVGAVVKNTNVRININGKTYYAKTDENGTFTFTQVILANKITYTLGYGGSATYNAYTSTKTTLTVA